MQSGDLSPHLDFLRRRSGTLPETIAGSDLYDLNLALGFLFALLRQARRLYDKEGDNGRAAAFTALGALWQFLVLFKGPCVDGSGLARTFFTSAALVGAAMCSAFECGTRDRWP